MVARRAHNPEARGSSPLPATKHKPPGIAISGVSIFSRETDIAKNVQYLFNIEIQTDSQYCVQIRIIVHKGSVLLYFVFSISKHTYAMVKYKKVEL